MAIIQFILALAVLGILYRKMVGRALPSPISVKQAVIPILLGVISLPLSFLLVLALTLSLQALGFNSTEAPLIVRSFLSALILAGFPEELAKLGMILLSLVIFRRGIRSVYDYILAGAAVGFGFTLLEEFFYGSDGLTALLRLVTITAHMLFGIVMAKHLGQARYAKEAGQGSPARETALAVLVPILAHTVFDACTGNSYFLKSESDTYVLLGIVLSLTATILMFVAQFKILSGLKKDAEKYCGMTFTS